MQLKQAVYPVFQPILRALRRNRWIIRRLFGVKVPPGVAVQFDPTTVLLTRALRAIAESEDRRALELGIGQGALVSLSLAHLKQIQLDGIDCSPTRVESSQRVAAYNEIAANFWLSDLFAQVPAENQYDLIFFNPPYVPTGVGEALKLTKRLEVDGDQVWDGGDDGTSVLREFLRQAPEYLSPRGRVVFGVQDIFVPDAKVLEVLAETRLALQQRVTKRMVPSVVYVLEHRGQAT